ncbi:MAG: amylo-alpha-1,6-glucosidase, partial [Ruminiclostridium sp.]|nr:amylo-alpha-1,6-glucosidase [Ruminiclostridium sp.]
KLAEKAKNSFIKLFWNENSNCLYDVINNQEKDDKIRPNQVLAVSLSFPIIEGEMAKSIVDTVYRELYTALGLRTLNQKAGEYKGIYIGNQYMRDGVYHQGTVWTWPLGQFITAYARAYKGDSNIVKKLDEFFLPFEDHLKDSCIGSISEIFDGNEPLIPRGCCAQAWSVSEILRAYVEDYLPLKDKNIEQVVI